MAAMEILKIKIFWCPRIDLINYLNKFGVGRSTASKKNKKERTKKKEQKRKNKKERTKKTYENIGENSPKLKWLYFYTLEKNQQKKCVLRMFFVCFSHRTKKPSEYVFSYVFSYAFSYVFQMTTFKWLYSNDSIQMTIFFSYVRKKYPNL